MESIDLATLAELNLTLLGFSAIIAIVQGGPIDQWPTRTRNALWLVVSVSSAALILCFVPLFIRAFGVSVYPLATAILLSYSLLGFLLSLRRSRKLSTAGHEPPSKPSWILAGFFTCFNILAQSLALAGFGNPESLYNLGVALTLFAAMLPLIVIVSSGKSGHDG